HAAAHMLGLPVEPLAPGRPFFMLSFRASRRVRAPGTPFFITSRASRQRLSGSSKVLIRSLHRMSALRTTFLFDVF
ncbi:hypothetical protein DW072_06095, partial [Bifidobacterium adolescentis]